MLTTEPSMTPERPCGVIVIPTFRRPEGLAKTLCHVARLVTTADLTVLVADNDLEQQAGVSVVRRLQRDGYRFPLRCITVAQTGVVRVRNVLLAEALSVPNATFVACLDDDEWPAPDWLSALLDMQQQTGADAIGGTVLPVFTAPPPAWIGRMELYWQEARDGSVDMLWATSNVLLSRAMIAELGPEFFDPRFGRSGGEDTEFFHRARAAGFRFAWASAAVVFETVPESRLSLNWMIKRSFRIGGTNALIQLGYRYKRLGRARVLAKACGRLLVTAVRSLLPLLGRSHPRRSQAVARFLFLSARSLGEVAALSGYRFVSYR